MMFILFSIVKRTLYQGILFQFIQADDRNKEVQSIDELVSKDFKVFMMPSSWVAFSACFKFVYIPFFQPRTHREHEVQE